MHTRPLMAAGLALAFLGCAITNYPVIFDSRGPWGESVLDGQYGEAYIIQESQVTTIWFDGSEELYSMVSQDWKGDQWLRTYNNFDPTATVLFMDQTYCDPSRQTQCAIVTSWNPDLPDAYPHGSSHDPGGGPGNGVTDDVFDGRFDWSCSGARSLSDLVSYQSRIGECGSGFWADKQNLAYEFSMLERVQFRGREVYEVPIDAGNTTYTLTARDGAVETAPIYGRSTVYVDEKLRTILPIQPHQRAFARWRNRFIDAHGAVVQVDVTYGSVRAHYDMKLSQLDESRF